MARYRSGARGANPGPLKGAGPPIAVVVCWVTMWVATVPLGDFPLNDDWTYGRAVQSVLETGRLSLLPWSAANAFAQIYWGALFCKVFGFSYETLRVSTAVLGAAGLVAVYGLLRELRAGAGMAALGALTVGGNPLYLSQSVTFMTDIPFAALVTVSLWLYATSVHRGRQLVGWAAYGVGLLAVLVRQFAVVLPVAFAASMIRRRPLSVWLVLMVLGSLLLFVALHLGFQRWMVATERTSGFESPVSAFLHLDRAVAGQRWRSSVLPIIGLLGMGLLPVAIVDPGRFWWGGRRARLVGWAATLALAGALAGVCMVKREIPPLAGNVVQQFGIGPLTLFDVYQLKRNLPVMPGADWFWGALTAGACWGAAVGVMAMASLAVQQLRGRRVGSEAQGHAAMLLGFVAAYGGAVLAFVAIAPLFDRYWIPMLAPFVAVVVLAGAERNRVGFGLSWVVVAAMAGFSVFGTHDWLAWQRSRWDAVRMLQARSIPASEIDGGYEFNGLTTYRPGRPDQTGKPGWWVVDNEYVLAGGPIDGFREIASFPVDAWLWRDGSRIVVLQRVESPPTPTLPTRGRG